MPGVDLFDLIYTFAHKNIKDLDAQLDGTAEEADVAVTTVADIDWLIAHNEGEYDGPPFG